MSEKLIVFADNWAQVPALTPSRRGHDKLETAIAEAKKVIHAGGNNAEDTVRIYRRPERAAFLVRAQAVASVRRAPNGRGFDVELRTN